jgi:uncharacterized protein
MLDNETLQQVLNDWSSWSLRPTDAVHRELADKCVITPEVVTVIQGVRRCGKSTLLRQLVTAKSIPESSAVFINFEDPRLVNDLDDSLLDQILQLSQTRSKEPLTFFLDEIQNVSHWQKWLNTQLEKMSGHCFVITGSNSQLLSGELASSLTGRHLRYELFPFDFHEFQSLVKSNNLIQFIQQGGFPAALNFPEPKELLQQYFIDIVEKDIRDRVSAKSNRPLQAVAKMAMESVGSELSLRRIAGVVQLSPETVNNYLQACEDAYLIFSCPFFAYSEAKRIRHNRKYYAIDTGMRRAVSTKLGADLGKDFENLVYLILRRKTLDICYWKGKGEVDFVINTDKGVTPIQVSIEEPQQRHEDALEEFYQSFPHANEAIYVTPETLDELVELLF